MAKKTRLSRPEIEIITKNYTTLCAEVHGYAYAAGSNESLLTSALAELSTKEQAFLLRVVAEITQKLADRKAAGVIACQ